MIQMMNDIWMSSQEAILIMNSITVVTANKPSFPSPIHYLQRKGGWAKKSVHEINMEKYYAIFTVRIPPSFKFLG